MYNFLQEYTKSSPENIIEEAVSYFQEDQNERLQKLYEFIDDFIASEEYEEYLRAKKNIVKKDACTQYNKNDSTVPKKIPSKKLKYPLTKRSRKIYALEMQLKKYLGNKRNFEIVQKQEQSIQLIVDKILYFKKLFLCSQGKLKDTATDDEYLKEFCLKYEIDFNYIRYKHKSVVLDKIICYQKIMKSQILKQEINMANIVAKLMSERTISKLPKSKKNIEKKIEEQSVSTIEEFEIEEEYITEDEETRVEMNQVEKSSKKTSIRESKTIEKFEKAAIKESKKSKESTKKGDKKKKQDILILPAIPICNKRVKIDLAFTNELSSLYKEFEAFDEALQNQHMLCLSSSVDLIKREYPLDEQIVCTPKELVYADFVVGNKYTTKLTILNKGPNMKKILLFPPYFPDELDKFLFHIEPLPTVIELASGCQLQTLITFLPDNKFVIRGELQLLTYTKKRESYEKFSMNIKCIPRYVDLKISCNHIDFQTVPFWKANKSFKVITFQNDGGQACNILIRKDEEDPIELSPTKFDINEKEYNFIDDILENLLENVIGPFHLEKQFLQLGGFKSINVKVHLRNVSCGESYCKKYYIDVYEDTIKNSLIGSRTILLTADISEHYLILSPTVLDFGACMLNSIYQTELNITNTSSTVHNVNVKFPTSLSTFMTCDLSNLYIPAKSTKKIWIKFSPRHSIKRSSYFDAVTSILSFSIKICISNKSSCCLLPMEHKALAIINALNFLEIIPVEKNLFQGNVLYLGDCSTYECTYTYFKVKNNSSVKQIYGFTNLPPCITIVPNFGFGDLMPGKSKILKLYFHPNLKDMPANVDEEEASFTLNLESLTSLGQIKDKLNNQRIRQSVDLMLKELKKGDGDYSLNKSINACKEAVRTFLCHQKTISEDQTACSIYGQSEENSEEMSNDTKATIIKKLNQFIVFANIIRPYFQPNFTRIVLPDTPCGSYSIKEIELCGMPNKDYSSDCNIPKRRTSSFVSKCEVFFRIFGNNKEIKVEPSYGIIQPNKIKKITIMAFPTIPENIIKNTVEIMKAKENNLVTTDQFPSDQKRLPKTKKNEKMEKVKKLNEKKNNNDVVDYYDYFPAEMFYWRNMDPYKIESKLLCEFRYGDYRKYKRPQHLFLDVSCNIIRPDFISNLKLQRIEFGTVALGSSAVQIITVQNIQYSDIELKLSILNPVGPFSIHFFKRLQVPSEYYLKLPVKFEPTSAQKFVEYFEITSDKTILPLILEGIGIKPEVIEVSPTFLVYRLETSRKVPIKCSFLITNKNSVSLNVVFKKVCELVGNIKATVIENTIEDDKMSKAKEKKSETKKRMMVVQQYSNELSEYEQSSIKEYFKKVEGPEFFKVENECVTVEKYSSVTVNIYFGHPDIWSEKKLPKGTSIHVTKNTTTKISDNKLYYISKFNIISSRTFVRDVILIGSFKTK